MGQQYDEKLPGCSEAIEQPRPPLFDSLGRVQNEELCAMLKSRAKE